MVNNTKSESPVCDVTIEQVLDAYYECRKNKRNTHSQLEFEADLEENIFSLYNDLITGEYTIGKSICFVVKSPNIREIWAASFRDRVVQHLIHSIISPKFHKSFIYDSCACIPERGTLFAAKRLEHHIRASSDNWKKDSYYLKMDLSNFFVSIDKDIVWDLMKNKLTNRHPCWVVELTKYVIFHDPRENPVFNSSIEERSLVEDRKRLELCGDNIGLPIGNLMSQFLANVIMDSFDKYVKHVLKVKHYIRYVDDFILLDNNKESLKSLIPLIKKKILSLRLRVNPRKTILQSVYRGIGFVGQLISPYTRTPLPKTVSRLLNNVNVNKNYNSCIAFAGQCRNGWMLRLKILRYALRDGRSVKIPISHV